MLIPPTESFDPTENKDNKLLFLRQVRDHSFMHAYLFFPMDYTHTHLFQSTNKTDGRVVCNRSMHKQNGR